MADSSLAIDSDDIVTLMNGTANTAVDVNTNVNTIVAAFNASLETETGHYHDGTDSRSVGSGFAGLTVTEFAIATLMGVFE